MHEPRRVRMGKSTVFFGMPAFMFVCMEKLGSRRTDFRKNVFWGGGRGARVEEFMCG